MLTNSKEVLQKIGLQVHKLIDSIFIIYQSHRIKMLIQSKSKFKVGQYVFRIIFNILAPSQNANPHQMSYFEWNDFNKMNNNRFIWAENLSQQVKQKEKSGQQKSGQQKIGQQKSVQQKSGQQKSVQQKSAQIGEKIKQCSIQTNKNEGIDKKQIIVDQKHRKLVNNEQDGGEQINSNQFLGLQQKIVQWLVGRAAEGLYTTKYEIRQQAQLLSQKNTFFHNSDHILDFFTKNPYMINYVDQRTFLKKQLNISAHKKNSTNPKQSSNHKNQKQINYKNDYTYQKANKLEKTSFSLWGKRRRKRAASFPVHKKSKFEYTKEEARKFLDQNQPDLSSDDLNQIAHMITEKGKQSYEKFQKQLICKYYD